MVKQLKMREYSSRTDFSFKMLCPSVLQFNVASKSNVLHS